MNSGRFSRGKPIQLPRKQAASTPYGFNHWNYYCVGDRVTERGKSRLIEDDVPRVVELVQHSMLHSVSVFFRVTAPPPIVERPSITQMAANDLRQVRAVAAIRTHALLFIATVTAINNSPVTSPWPRNREFVAGCPVVVEVVIEPLRTFREQPPSGPCHSESSFFSRGPAAPERPPAHRGALRR
jgi:hypothetical protein